MDSMIHQKVLLDWRLLNRCPNSQLSLIGEKVYEYNRTIKICVEYQTNHVVPTLPADLHYRWTFCNTPCVYEHPLTHPIENSLYLSPTLSCLKIVRSNLMSTDFVRKLLICLHMRNYLPVLRKIEWTFRKVQCYPCLDHALTFPTTTFRTVLT